MEVCEKVEKVLIASDPDRMVEINENIRSILREAENKGAELEKDTLSGRKIEYRKMVEAYTHLFIYYSQPIDTEPTGPEPDPPHKNSVYTNVKERLDYEKKRLRFLKSKYSLDFDTTFNTFLGIFMGKGQKAKSSRGSRVASAGVEKTIEQELEEKGGYDYILLLCVGVVFVICSVMCYYLYFQGLDEEGPVGPSFSRPMY